VGTVRRFSTLSDKIEWVVTAGLPYGGTYRGRDAVLANVFARFDTEWEGFAVAPAELFAVEDVVIALGNYQGRRRETGKLDSVGDLGVSQCGFMINGHARAVRKIDTCRGVCCRSVPVPVSKFRL
jgi:hypothetical protein